MYHFIILCLLIPATSLICMDKPSFVKTSADKPSQKMAILELDDGSQYSIQKWKVKQESNTLCKCYYSQKKKNPILVPHISSEEITLFDQALDKNISKFHPDSFSNYYDELNQAQQRTLTIAAGKYGSDGKTKKLCALRLTAQIANRWLGQETANKNILPQCIIERTNIAMHLKSSLISKNVCQNMIMQSPITSYSLNNASKKIEESGIMLCTPKIPNLELPNFNGKPNDWAILDEEKMQYPMQLWSPKNHLFVTSAKIINDRIDRSKLHLWKGTLQGDRIIKTIDHDAFISVLSFSPDQKWLVTLSCDLRYKQNSKLMLTKTDPSSDQYLSDVMVIPEWNSSQTFCLNKASTLLVYTQKQKLEFFSLQKQEIICSLELPKGLIPLTHIESNTNIAMKYNPRLIKLEFNHDDTRLIACLADGILENNNSTFIIWDVSDINNPKELQLMHIPIKKSSVYATITFNYPNKDIVAISTDYTTFFFDVKSGNFLSKTEDVIGQENAVFAATCAIPFSPIFYIAKNIDNKTSCVNLHDCRSGKCEGTIVFDQPSIEAIGMTKNARSLVTTFKEFKSITTEILSEEKDNPITILINNTGLVTFYGLLQLYKAKKENKKAYISPPLLEYMQKFSEGKSYKDIVDKYLL